MGTSPRDSCSRAMNASTGVRTREACFTVGTAGRARGLKAQWATSAASGQGARSFYYPPAPQQCSGCHMPLVDSTDPAARNGKVRSHRFIGANTALPFVNHDQEQLKLTQDFLRDGQLSVDIFGLTRSNDVADAHRAEEDRREPASQRARYPPARVRIDESFPPRK